MTVEKLKRTVREAEQKLAGSIDDRHELKELQGGSTEQKGEESKIEETELKRIIVQSFQTHNHLVLCLQVLPTGHLASGSWNKTIKV